MLGFFLQWSPEFFDDPVANPPKHIAVSFYGGYKYKGHLDIWALLTIFIDAYTLLDFKNTLPLDHLLDLRMI
jgi:hypothetical protein